MLKITKCFFGVTKVNFFGYEVTQGKYTLSQERRDSIRALQFPTNTQQLQSLLGSTMYFKSHIPMYSELTAPLNEMVKKDFSWDKRTWTRDYEADLERLKLAIADCATVYFPDYSLNWVLRTDASTVACGGTLLQEAIDPTSHESSWQVIAFVSMKFSDAATRWDIPKKEAYGIYFSVHSLAYYLACKAFVVETDHANLQWIERSEHAIVIRWRLYLQNFTFWIKHIPGKLNVFADMLSRMYLMTHAEMDSIMAATSPTQRINELHLFLLQYIPSSLTISEKLVEAHVVNRRHLSLRDTRHNLNAMFPGHRIHYRIVMDFYYACPVCQKARLGLSALDTIEPIVRNLKPDHCRGRIGIDMMDVTPHDKFGHVAMHIIVDHFSNCVALYPVKEKTAKATAMCLFLFFITYGTFEELAMDPGSTYTSDVVSELNRLFGMKQRFGLVGVHTSSGVEGTNNLTLHILRMITVDPLFRDRWGAPEVVGLSAFLINDMVSRETGIRRFDLLLGRWISTLSA
jgi:hypothetical protein